MNDYTNPMSIISILNMASHGISNYPTASYFKELDECGEALEAFLHDRQEKDKSGVFPVDDKLFRIDDEPDEK